MSLRLGSLQRPRRIIETAPTLCPLLRKMLYNVAGSPNMNGFALVIEDDQDQAFVLAEALLAAGFEAEIV